MRCAPAPRARSAREGVYFFLNKKGFKKWGPRSGGGDCKKEEGARARKKKLSNFHSSKKTSTPLSNMKLWLGKFPGCLRPPWLSSRSTTRQLRARFQRLPEAPKDFPKDSLQDPPGSSRILQDSPGSTRILQDPPGSIFHTPVQVRSTVAAVHGSLRAVILRMSCGH